MAIGGIFLFAAKYANSWEVLAVGRLIIGVNAGLNAGISPMYLSEISPVALRGAVGTVYQLIITISILISQGDIIFKKNSSNHLIIQKIILKLTMISQFFQVHCCLLINVAV